MQSVNCSKNGKMLIPTTYTYCKQQMFSKFCSFFLKYKLKLSLWAKMNCKSTYRTEHFLQWSTSHKEAPKMSRPYLFLLFFTPTKSHLLQSCRCMRERKRKKKMTALKKGDFRSRHFVKNISLTFIGRPSFKVYWLQFITSLQKHANGSDAAAAAAADGDIIARWLVKLILSLPWMEPYESQWCVHSTFGGLRTRSKWGGWQ